MLTAFQSDCHPPKLSAYRVPTLLHQPSVYVLHTERRASEDTMASLYGVFLLDSYHALTALSV